MGGTHGPMCPDVRFTLTQNTFANTQLPFLYMLDLPNLLRIKNDSILHNLLWLAIPHKIPLEIPKFDDKIGEDPSMHITTYHLWCVSNSMLDDSVKLHILPCTLTKSASK